MAISVSIDLLGEEERDTIYLIFLGLLIGCATFSQQELNMGISYHG